MSGFLVQSFPERAIPVSAMKLVDLGSCEITGTCEFANVRAAWAYWRNSRQWRVTRTANRMALIEGQPDRYPDPGESIEQWLDGRSGSFRGFEIVSDNATQHAKLLVFADPLCTRPLYYLQNNGAVCVSDKLSTLILNSASACEPDWGGLLEGAVLGSLYSYKTTVKDAVWVPPGEALEFEGTVLKRRWKNALPQDAALQQSEVLARPAETLRIALEKAIRETWTDPEMRLLLSGGLDSRILLVLAPGKRKTLTLELYSGETEIAKQVAAASGSDLELVPVADFEFPMRWAYLVTGAMHDSRFVTHLGQVRDWRDRGITGVTHGYFHNTMYRGWTAGRYLRHPNQESILFEWMGRNAYYFDTYGCKPWLFPRQFYEVLSEDGQAVLRGQLRELSQSLVPVIEDGYDLTFERRLMEFVPRQIYFCVMLAWYEALDVASPIFQPSVWTWYAWSRAKHRDRDWAIRELFLSLNHPAAKLADSNTGQPIAHLQADWRDPFRDQLWYRTLRAVYKKLFWKPMSFEQDARLWGDRLRRPTSLEVLEDGASVLRDNPLFEPARIAAALQAYRNGDNQAVDTIAALTVVGQWQRLVSRPESQTEFVRTLDVAEPDVAQLHATGKADRV